MLAASGLASALRPPLSALWQAPGARPDPAAWHPLLATLQHLAERFGAPAAADAAAVGSLLSLVEALARLRMRLAEAAGAAGNTRFAVRLLDYEPMLSPGWDDSGGPDGSPSPLHLLTHLQGAALLARLPGSGSGGSGGAAAAAAMLAPGGLADAAMHDALLGSGSAPACARRLLALVGGLVQPGDGADSQAAAAAAGSAAALEPFMQSMPPAVRAAAADGCLLLAGWAQVKRQSTAARRSQAALG